MTLASPSAGHDPALPADKPKAKLADIHADALALTGLLYVLD